MGHASSTVEIFNDSLSVTVFRNSREQHFLSACHLSHTWHISQLGFSHLSTIQYISFFHFRELSLIHVWVSLHYTWYLYSNTHCTNESVLSLTFIYHLNFVFFLAAFIFWNPKAFLYANNLLSRSLFCCALQSSIWFLSSPDPLLA